jgi:hypothetical protein
VLLEEVVEEKINHVSRKIITNIDNSCGEKGETS